MGHKLHPQRGLRHTLRGVALLVDEGSWAVLTAFGPLPVAWNSHQLIGQHLGP